MRLLKLAAIGLAVASAWPVARAGNFNESEPNNTFAGAQLINDPGSVQTVINGQRTFQDPSDDFFRFFVATPSTLQIRSSSPIGAADSIMGLFNAGGTLLASNDDAALGNSMSAITFNALASGFYTIGFSGYNPGLLSCTATVTSCYDTNNDFAFDTFVAGGGAGGSTGWAYAITIDQVTAVPEPETYLLLGIGLAAIPWLRKRGVTVRRRGREAAL